MGDVVRLRAWTRFPEAIGMIVCEEKDGTVKILVARDDIILSFSPWDYEVISESR
jgi:hypothetical protein